MSTPQPKPWLRGPAFAPAALRRGRPDVPMELPQGEAGSPIPALLQPAAHAFIMSIEDCEATVRDLPGELLWLELGAASIGLLTIHLP